MSQSVEARSRIMRAIRSKNTGPELAVRSALWRQGYRFRVNVKELPGRPDLAFTAKKVAVFVHGCYWHQHHCQNGRVPQNNTGFWVDKFKRNRERDEAAQLALKNLGWKPVVIWECELADLPKVVRRLTKALGDPKTSAQKL